MRPPRARIPACNRIFIYGAAHEMPIAATVPWIGLVGEFVDRGEYFLVNRGAPGTPPG